MSPAPDDPSGISLVSVWHTSPTGIQISGARYTREECGKKSDYHHSLTFTDHSLVVVKGLM